MRRALLLFVLLPERVYAQAPAPGIYTNEEEVYFEREAGRAAVPWTGLRVTDGAIAKIDAFGAPADDTSLRIAEATPDGLRVMLAGGRTTALRRARPVACWAASLKSAPKPGGLEEWHFVRDLKLHDQGGRVAVGSEGGARPLVLRMRNVVWQQDPNRPSLVLYVHKPNAPDRAEAYSWADPQATRIGINLRWMQASCTIDPIQGETKP